MNKEEAQDLLRRYQEGTCTPEEKILVDNWYLQQVQSAPHFEAETRVTDLQQEVWERLQKVPQKRVVHFSLVKIAASLVLGLGLAAGGYILYQQTHQPPLMALVAKDIAPGRNRAILTLANGQRVDLDSRPAGVIASQQGVQVQKSNGGKISYTAQQGIAAPAAGTTNNITTPNGGQYAIVLPDGTQVWLNAATSLTYPVTFSGSKERVVKLKGEAYFEVHKDASHPFRVISDDQEVLVLGTHFDINTYNDEAGVKTTLAEGSVQIKTKDHAQRLRPGQQSIVSPSGIKINTVNADDLIAWKDGQYVFTHTDLRVVMANIARWYDVAIDFDQLPAHTYVDGVMQRSLPLSKALHLVSLSVDQKIKFIIQGRRITIN